MAMFQWEAIRNLTGLGPEPFNFTPMGVNSISSGSPRVRPMGRTCGEPDEIKKNTHPKNFTALFRVQARDGVKPDPSQLLPYPG